jgi:hypothetical protein
LYWNLNLNRSSRYHSKDMADNNCWSHNSCNGDSCRVRLASYYPGISWWGENIAAGNSQVLATMRQWITEGKCPPPSDNSDSSGHRNNIMSANFRQLGCGYGYNISSTWGYYWTQDYAGNTSTYADRHLVSGSHDATLMANKISFLLNYYDASGKAPVSKSVVVDGVSIAMALWMGTASSGTYRLDLIKGATCRNYYFLFTDGDNIACRYPESGDLMTFGEGNCARDYLPPESLGVAMHAPVTTGGLVQHLDGKVLVIVVLDPAFSPTRTEILDILGRSVLVKSWTGGFEKERLTLPNRLPNGLYFVRHFLQHGRIQTVRFVVME